MYVFRRKHYDVFTTLIFNPLKTRPDFLLIVKFLLIQGYPEKKGDQYAHLHPLAESQEGRA